MNAFFKALGESKIPTLLLIGLIFYMGCWLLINSGNNPSATPAGYGVLIFGAILSVITFVDYRSKEHIDNLLNYYKTALENISKTHSSFENSTQDKLNYGDEKRKIGGDVYTVESLENTTSK